MKKIIFLSTFMATFMAILFVTPPTSYALELRDDRTLLVKTFPWMSLTQSGYPKVSSLNFTPSPSASLKCITQAYTTDGFVWDEKSIENAKWTKLEEPATLLNWGSECLPSSAANLPRQHFVGTSGGKIMYRELPLPWFDNYKFNKETVNYKLTGLLGSIDLNADVEGMKTHPVLNCRNRQLTAIQNALYSFLFEARPEQAALLENIWLVAVNIDFRKESSLMAQQAGDLIPHALKPMLQVFKEGNDSTQKTVLVAWSLLTDSRCQITPTEEILTHLKAATQSNFETVDTEVKAGQLQHETNELFEKIQNRKP